MAPQTTKVCTLTPQTINTLKKVSFWRNISILPLPHVIFQLKNNIKNSKKKTKIFFFLFLKNYYDLPKNILLLSNIIVGHNAHLQLSELVPALSERGHV
jgi:hypothetical protein